MGKDNKRLGDAELEIMQAVWEAGEAVTSKQVLSALEGRRNWALATLMTALNRLCEKGFLRCDKQGWNNFYTPLITQEAYRQSEGRTMLERVYGNSVTGLVAALYAGRSISEQDVADLRKLLDQWEDEK